MRVLEDKTPNKVEAAFLVGYCYLQILPYESVLDKKSIQAFFFSFEKLYLEKMVSAFLMPCQKAAVGDSRCWDDQ